MMDPRMAPPIENIHLTVPYSMLVEVRYSGTGHICTVVKTLSGKHKVGETVIIRRSTSQAFLGTVQRDNCLYELYLINDRHVLGTVAETKA